MYMPLYKYVSCTICVPKNKTFLDLSYIIVSNKLLVPTLSNIIGNGNIIKIMLVSNNNSIDDKDNKLTTGFITNLFQ